MRIVNLVENTVCGQELGCEHGLSFYIETGKHRLLVDMGATGLFAENAEKLGVDLTEVDLAFLSHGHYDHGGGLQTFLEMNEKAPVYLRKEAFGKYFSQHGEERRYIGLAPELLGNPRLVFTEAMQTVAEGITVFSGVSHTESAPDGSLWPESNRTLLEEKDGEIVRDIFSHEQNLVIREQGKTLLVCGCAHNGIANILTRYEKLFGGRPDVVVGGFHLMRPGGQEHPDEELVRRTAEYLRAGDTVYYTGHCTGIPARELLQEILGERVRALYSGREIFV
ncbi:MAG: MBL fold metallo-hydrolase [Eubacteriales bacterium]|nr:MBL fold metallo-hydrolase [Eubacteriales bacterium]